MDVRITVEGDLRFVAHFERERAPRSCVAFGALLPFRRQLLQARWSGESAWIPLGDFDFGVPAENITSTPGPGELLLYPSGRSESEILVPYGVTRFGSKYGELAGNHFLTIVEGLELLSELGRRVLWEGAQEIVFDVV